MFGLTRKPIFAVVGFLILSAAVAAAVGWFSYTASLGQIRDRGEADLSLASDRLVGHLQRYRELAVVLADHPLLMRLAATDTGRKADARFLLQEMADKTGAYELRLLTDYGLSVGQLSEFDVHLAEPAIERAYTGALGATHFVGADGRRLYTYAAPIFPGAGAAKGVVMATVAIDSLEWNWPTDPAPVFFTDEDGLVFMSNRSELILTSRVDNLGLPFPTVELRKAGEHEIWNIEAGPYLPSSAIHLSKPLPVIGMTAEILLDTAPARRIALLQASVAGALMIVFGSFVFLASIRRRALAERLQVEARANAELERRVRARTRELSAANESLRREVSEREDAEAALRRAQAELVQAGKLSALGQMSAGISHELNQPLMAIGSFAENAGTFLDRGDAPKVKENLSRISDMAERMGRIIRNLRAFARQESAPTTNVDLVKVVDIVLELVQRRLEEDRIEVLWSPPAVSVPVRGGEVRLQQVVLNLITNAADAMAGSDTRRLSIAINCGQDWIELDIADTGPGIDDPGKIFDPFYTTKEVGKSEGMGLGLSISYGIVQSFGGDIRGRNRADGGAVFSLRLMAQDQEKAA